MAHVVGYHDDDVTYEEGPFVISNPLGNGWRIEVEVVGHRCPVLPDVSIYSIMDAMKFRGKTHDKALAESVCDRLNAMVRTGRIVCTASGWWTDAARLGDPRCHCTA